MMTTSGFVELLAATVSIFVASFAVGFLIRSQLMGPNSFVAKLLVFFAVVALAGGSLGAYYTGVAWARHNQGITNPLAPK